MDKKFLRESAQRALQKGELTKALSLYKEVSDAEPEDLQTRNTLGDICVRLGKLDEAVKYYIQVAKEIARKGFYHKAIAIHKKSLRIAPENPSIYQEMAELYRLLKLSNEARACYNWLLKYFRSAGMRNDEIAVMKKLVSLAPNDESAKNELINKLVDSGSVEEASNQHLFSGKKSYDAQQYEEAFAYFEDSIRIYPDNLEALLMGGDCLLKLGRQNEALEYFENALKRDNENINVLKQLSRVYYMEERYAEALALIIKIVEKDPQNLEYSKLLLRVYAKLGKMKEAVECSQNVLSLLISQQNYDEFFVICEDLEKKGMFEMSARKKRAEISEIVGDINSAVSDYCAIVEELIKDDYCKEAIDLAEKALKLSPENAEIRKQIEIIKTKRGTRVDRGESLSPADSSLRVTNERKVPRGVIFDLSSELKKEMNERNNNKDEKILPVNDVSSAVSDATLSEFKKEVDNKIDAKDTATHFNLGMAYMQMELFEDAISEFIKAKNDKTYTLDCITFMAECEHKLGRSESAIEMLMSVINNYVGELERIIPLKYTAAKFLEEIKMFDRAMDLYLDVSNSNPGYKDVKQRIAFLQKTTGSFSVTRRN